MATIKLIDSWNEVNLETYLKVAEIRNNEKTEHYNLQRAVSLIAALSDKTEAEILKFEHSMLATCLDKIAFVNKDEIEDLSRDPFEINGVKYMFTPDFDKLTTGEMISVEQLIMTASETGANYLPELLAILIRPAEKDGDGWRIQEFNAITLEMRKKTFNKYLKVPFFLPRLMDSFNGLDLSERILAQFSEQAKEAKANIKRLVN